MNRDGWTPARLGEVARQVSEHVHDPAASGIRRYVGLDHIDPDELHIERWGNVEDGTTFTRRFRPGQLLFGRRRAYQRKAAVPDFDGVCSGDLIVIEADAGRLDPRLLPHIVHTDRFFELAVGTSAGSLSPRTKWKSIAGYEFMLPPLDRQTEIVESLSAVELSLGCARNVASSAETLLLSKLNKVASEGHPTVPLKEVMPNSPESGYSPNAIDKDEGFYVLTLAAAGRAGFDSTARKPIDPGDFKPSKELNEGDLLITRSNTIELVGRVARVTGLQGPTMFSDLFMRLTLDPERIDPEYAEAVLQAPGTQRMIRASAAGTSGSMKKINRTGLERIEIPCPPLSTQEAAIAPLSELRRLVDEAHRHSMKLKAVRSRLTNALVGGHP